MVETDISIFKTVFYYSIAILLLPIAAFFTTKVFLFDGIIGTSSTVSNVWSAICAIVVLHIAVGLFILRAYTVAEKSKVERKDDKID